MKKSNVAKFKIPENHIVIDFDLKDENGNKSFERNLIVVQLSRQKSKLFIMN